MRFRLMVMLSIASLGGCSWLTASQEYSVYFQPYSTEIDFQGLGTIHDAAAFAQDHPYRLVAVEGFAAPPAPNREADALSAQRAEMVRQVLVSDGVRPDRITMAANGLTNPKHLPDLSVRRVDISVGK